MSPGLANGSPAPLAAQDRIPLLDVLRGFAVFGILLANIMPLSGYTVLSPARQAELATAALDRAVTFLINVLVYGKFYSVFSFLFGLGFAVQILRAERREGSFARLYVRRLLILLLLGVAHAYLIWAGDILTLYAVLGFTLLLFCRLSDRALLGWALFLLLLPVVVDSMPLLKGRPEPAPAPVAAPPRPAAAAAAAAASGGGERDYLTVMSEGSYAEILRLNAQTVLARYVGFLTSSRWAKVLGMFLLGLYAGRRRMFEDVGAHLGLARRLLGWGLALGIPANLALAVLMERRGGPLLDALESIVYAVGVPSLCFAYIAAMTLLFQHPGWQRRLARLAPVGRTALSNYLFQSMTCVLLFNGYGLGLFGKLSATGCIALAVLLFAVEIVLSRWWLRRFRYGPFEWVWRCATYKKVLPIWSPAAP